METDILNYSYKDEEHNKVHIFSWIINDFLNILSEQSCNGLRTRFTTLTSQPEAKIRLKLNFVGHKHDLIELYFVCTPAMLIKSSVDVCLERFEEHTIMIQDYQKIPCNSWKYLGTIHRRDVIGMDEPSYIFPDGSLRLKISFYTFHETSLSAVRPAGPAISSDFAKLFKDGTYTDVTVTSDDGVSFQAHKIVLASRSEVFRATFEHDVIVRNTSIIHTALAGVVLHAVLSFIYTDEAPDAQEIPVELFVAADYYQLPRLKSLCEEALHSQLTLDNAIPTLELAERHSAPHLLQVTLHYIKHNCKGWVTRTEGWANIKSLDLVKKMYECVCVTQGNDDM